MFPLSLFLPMMIPVPGMGILESTCFGFGIAAGYEFGRYVGPDADIMGTTSSEGWMVNELPLVGHFLFGVLSAYGSIFRRHHRSFWTHFPFVSTSIRYLLIFWWVWVQIYWSKTNLAWLIWIFIGMFLGTSIADGIHYYLDMVKYPKSE